MSNKPGELVVERFGGITKTEKLLRLPITTVQGWKDSGFVPAKRQKHVLNTAEKNNISLTAEEIIGVQPPE